MKNSVLVSFIIPMYNAENYIKDCIVSIVKQNLKNDEFEIIVINDGSTDNSVDILMRLQETYHNIILINQQNKGAAAARNIGILKAIGKYVQFLDADDRLEENCLLQILTQDNILQDLDIIQFNFKRIINGKEVIHQEMKNNTTSIVSGIDYIIYNNIFTSACFFLVKRNLLIDYSLFFREGMVGEDIDFTHKCFYYCKKIKYIPIIYYINNTNPNSVTNNPSKTFIKDIVFAVHRMMLFYIRVPEWITNKKLKEKIIQEIIKLTRIAYSYTIYYGYGDNLYIIKDTKQHINEIREIINKRLNKKMNLILFSWVYLPYLYAFFISLKTTYYNLRK